MKDLAINGELSGADIIETVMKMTKNCVPQDQFRTLKKEALDLRKTVDKFSDFSEKADQQLVDYKYALVKHDHYLQEFKHAQQLCVQQAAMAEKTFTKKYETELLHEELQRMMLGRNSRFSENDGDGEGDSRGSKMRTVNPTKGGRKKPGKQSGMSLEERTQLKEMQDQITRIMTTQKRVDQQL